MKKIRYMISDAANLVQVESHVLRYWEEELNLDIPRNEMGHRYYTEENIEQFMEIKKWKEQGYQLKAIRMLVHEDEVKEMAGEKKKIESKDKKSGQVLPEKSRKNEMVTKGNVHKSPAQDTSTDNTFKLEQFRVMMTDIVKSAMEENNQSLGEEVSYQVGDKVVKEMNYLMRVQEEAEEDRYRKLDAAIKAQKQGRRVKEEKAEKKKRLFRKDKKANPNLSVE